MNRSKDFIYAHKLWRWITYPTQISGDLVHLHEEFRKHPSLVRGQVGHLLWDYLDREAALAFCAQLRLKYGGSMGKLHSSIVAKYKLIGERNAARFRAMTPEYAREAILALKSRALDWPEALPPGLDPQEVADKTGLTGTCDYWKGVKRHFHRYVPRTTVTK
jgi:hypothetical protein